MKNIHKINQHIYITNDEEIKEGDWMIRGNEQPTLVTPNFFWDFGVRYYKIILTTKPFQSEEKGYLIHCPDNEVLEEPKQLTDLEIAIKLEEIQREEPKQETKEEPDYEKIKQALIEFRKTPMTFVPDERMYSEEDLKEAYFSAISSTGEGWNGEYANGNNPNIEEKFKEGFDEWFNKFKNK
jgi:hypothetical protein